MNRTTNQTQRTQGRHTIGWIATVLVIVGALNWLMVGLFQTDVVASLFGGTSAMLARIVYALVGIAGLYEIYFARLLARESHGTTSPLMRAT